MKNKAIKSMMLCLLSVGQQALQAAAGAADQPEKKDGIYELQVQPDGQYGTPYTPELTITDQQKQQTVFVPQKFYVVLDATTKIQRAIVGPCCPCFMVAVRNEDTDKTLVFHIPFDYHKYQKKLVKVLQEVFDLKKVEELHEWKVALFTKSFAQAPLELQEAAKWNADKQQKGFDALKECLQTTLKTHAKAVCLQTMFFNGSARGLSRADHPEIEKTVAVDKDLRVVSVSLLSQGLYELMSPTESEQSSYEKFYPLVVEKYTESFGDEELLIRIPDEEAGFESLKERLKFVLKRTGHIAMRTKRKSE